MSASIRSMQFLYRKEDRHGHHLAAGRVRILPTLCGTGGSVRLTQDRRLIMDWAIVLGLVVLLVLIVYLAIALIKPEYFS